MPFFTSPPLTVNDVFEWVNGLFGGRIPTIPLPSNWGAALRRLWNTFVIGDLPDPDEPKPWRIEIEGSWQPFDSCSATFHCMSIDIYDGGTVPSPPLCSPASPPIPELTAATPKSRVVSKNARAPARRAREPAGSPGRADYASFRLDHLNRRNHRP